MATPIHKHKYIHKQQPHSSPHIPIPKFVNNTFYAADDRRNRINFTPNCSTVRKCLRWVLNIFGNSETCIGSFAVPSNPSTLIIPSSHPNPPPPPVPHCHVCHPLGFRAACQVALWWLWGRSWRGRGPPLWLCGTTPAGGTHSSLKP